MKKFRNKYFKWFFRFSSILVVLFLMSIIRIDYYIYVPGNLSDISKEVTFEDNKQLNGSVSSIYILQFERPSIFEYCIAKLMPYSEIYKMSDSERQSIDNDLDYAIGTFQSNLSFSNAMLASYSLLNPLDNDYYREIVYIYSAPKTIESNYSYTNIVGKAIYSIDGVNYYPTYTEVYNYLNNNDNCNLTLIDSNNNTYDLVLSNKSKERFGLILTQSFELTKDISASIDNVYTQGPSGGAMNSLYMYLMNIDEDLLKGRKITGTGTIGAAYLNQELIFDYVGAIGCVKEKLFAAYIDKADVFYCPHENYSELLEGLEKYTNLGYDFSNMRIVEVYTLNDIIDDLRGDN